MTIITEHHETILIEEGKERPPSKAQLEELKMLTRLLSAKITLRDELGRFISSAKSEAHVQAAIEILREEAKQRGIAIPGKRSGCRCCFILFVLIVAALSLLMIFGPRPQ